MSELPAWVVDRCADELVDVANGARMEQQRHLNSEDVARTVLAEFLAILDERGLRVVPVEMAPRSYAAVKKPVPELRRDAGEEPGEDDWISNHRLLHHSLVRGRGVRAPVCLPGHNRVARLHAAAR